MASDYDFGAAFARIEDELIDSMMRNLRRYHLDWEDAEGFDWSQWQVEQLRSLEEYRAANEKRFGPRFARINARLTEAIRHGYQNGQKAEEMNILNALSGNRRTSRTGQPKGISGAGDAFFRVNDRKLEALLTATQSDMQKAEHAVLRRSNDQYRKIIFQAQTYANTGAGTIEKAVDMATKDFLMRGIDCIEYKNGARHTISDYADMAIRTAERRAYLWGEGQKRQEWGVSLVIVNKRGGHPCPECARWLGKILIDDVYSGGKPDGKHTLLSEAMAQGFLHPRCKDGFTTYFPGITSVPDPATKAELREAERAEERETREQHAENMAEKWDRRAKYSLDPDNKRTAEARAEEWHEEAVNLSAGSGIEPGIDWPSARDPISKDAYNAIMDYAREKSVKLEGFKRFDGDPDEIIALINQVSKMSERYPVLTARKGSVVLNLAHRMGSADFAMFQGHTIYLNADAYRDITRLKQEYDRLVQSKWFVAGTDYHAIPYHEIGHFMEETYNIDGLRIAKQITGIQSTPELMEYLKDNLSEYAACFEDGSEIISECFSSVFGSSVENDFALRFVGECDKLITKKGVLRQL